MINAELARAFDRNADLMEIDGADAFRVNSYRRVARTIKNSTEDMAVVSAEGRLSELPGVGKGTAERIRQFLESRRIDVLEELEAKFPPGLPELLEIPGFGPKKVALVYSKLDVRGMDDLKRVIESGELTAMPGLGETSVRKIAEGLRFLESSGGRTPLGLALPLARAFAERIAGLPGVKQVELAGSLRRGAETIGDIDILCEAADGEAIIKAFVAFGEVKRVLASGTTKGSITVQLGKSREVQIDLRVVAGESFGAALQYFTGSKEHNVRLRERALARKLRLNEYGLFDGDKPIAGKKEADIYRNLDLPFIPPELREDRGELDGKKAPLLVTLEDIRGDLHMHTTASDGKCSIEEMAVSARNLGYEYIAICDHSKSSVIANGLSVERMKEHIKTIRAAAKSTPGITVLVGCECDILPDGTMDYPDEILAECDWVVASIHSAMGSSESDKLSPTQRTIAAMENRFVSAIGHPTGRLINKRAAMELDMAAVMQGAVRTQTILEVNANWMRLDLKDHYVRQALEQGATLVIDTDAHHTEQLHQMQFGVTTARRGGATKGDVVNCLTLSALCKRIAAKRG